MDLLIAVALTAGVLFGLWFALCKGMKDSTDFIRMVNSKMPWGSHPNAIWNTGAVIFAVILLCSIWGAFGFRAYHKAQANEPVKKEQASTKEESSQQPAVPDVAPKPPRVINKQAVEMANEFDALTNTVSNKALAEHETKFYSEYLSATMPAKIASICGKIECDQYRQLLRHLQSQTDSLRLQFHGLRPFVTRERFIDPETPFSRRADRSTVRNYKTSAGA